MHTGFTQAECTNFATQYNALTAATPTVSYPPVLLCTTSGCNGLVAVASAAGRVAAGATAVAALAAAAALL